MSTATNPSLTPPVPGFATEGESAEGASVPAQAMRELLDVSRELAVTSDLGRLLPLICHAATRMLHADRSSLFLYDAAHDQLWTKVALGTQEIRVPSGAGIVGEVFRTRMPLVIPDAYADERFNRQVDVRTGYRTRNLLTLPVFDLDGAPVAVLQVINKDPAVGNGDFTPSDQLLARLLGDQAGVAIQRYHLQEKALEAVAMQKEMDLARRVQEAMIPKEPPVIPGLEVAGWNRPASTTGGDAYDLWRSRDGRLAIFVADATGHGIAPALVVSQARALVRVLSDDAFEPRDIFTRVNERLAADLESGMFVTAFLALISPDGELRWCSAGHGPVLMRSRPGGPIDEILPPGPPLGILDPFMVEECPPRRLERGGWLAVITDGITESWSPEKELFGREKLVESLESAAHLGPAAWIEDVRGRLSAWQRTRDPSDDQTLVMVRRA